jgi:hypothetical protein
MIRLSMIVPVRVADGFTPVCCDWSMVVVPPTGAPEAPAVPGAAGAPDRNVVGSDPGGGAEGGELDPK